jgi:hypothetical protein
MRRTRRTATRITVRIPQDHATRYRLQLQSRRHARHSEASTARAQSGSRVVWTRGGARSRVGRSLTGFGSHPRSLSRLSSARRGGL